MWCVTQMGPQQHRAVNLLLLAFDSGVSRSHLWRPFIIWTQWLWGVNHCAGPHVYAKQHQSITATDSLTGNDVLHKSAIFAEKPNFNFGGALHPISIFNHSSPQWQWVTQHSSPVAVHCWVLIVHSSPVAVGYSTFHPQSGWGFLLLSISSSLWTVQVLFAGECMAGECMAREGIVIIKPGNVFFWLFPGPYSRLRNCPRTPNFSYSTPSEYYMLWHSKHSNHLLLITLHFSWYNIIVLLYVALVSPQRPTQKILPFPPSSTVIVKCSQQGGIKKSLLLL